MKPTDQEICKAWDDLGRAVHGVAMKMPLHVLRWFVENEHLNLHAGLVNDLDEALADRT